MERFFYYPTAEPTPVPRHFSGAESVWFRSADGTSLHGWFIPSQHRPAGAGGPSVATILHVHGNAGSILSHIGFIDYLPSAGFNLFIFDYRGYGQSEGRASKRAALIADTHAALDALLGRADVDPQHIGVYGQSLGGTIALNMMADRSEIKAAVIESAFVSWREMAACSLGGEGANFMCRGLAAALISDTHRADRAIAVIQRPILLMHASLDTIVPVSNSRALFKASPAHAALIEWPGGDHNSLRDAHPELEQRVIDFFRQSLFDPQDNTDSIKGTLPKPR